jgi:uncharacterized protein (DUF488 family)
MIWGSAHPEKEVMSLQLLTIGHSTRAFEEFLELLQQQHIESLIDVRTIPQSRRVPWSNKKYLSKTLLEKNIVYVHMPELGGLRHPLRNSINTGWKNSAFRGYADYMQTSDFKNGINKLNALIEKYHNRLVIMCAEAVPWHCHRSLIADAEIAKGVTVQHIMGGKKLYPHQLTEFAVIGTDTDPEQVWYPASRSRNLDL